MIYRWKYIDCLSDLNLQVQIHRLFVSVDVYLYIQIFIYTYTCINTYRFECMVVTIKMYLDTYMIVHTRIHMWKINMYIWICTYTDTYVDINMYIWIHTYAHTCKSQYTNISLYANMYIYEYTNIYLAILIGVYIYTYTCEYTHLYVHIHIQIHIDNFWTT